MQILRQKVYQLNLWMAPSSNDSDGGGCAPPDYTAKLCMDQKLYFQYFVQDDVEDGTLMDTKIPIDEVCLLD